MEFPPRGFPLAYHAGSGGLPLPQAGGGWAHPLTLPRLLPAQTCHHDKGQMPAVPAVEGELCAFARLTSEMRSVSEVTRSRPSFS